MEGGKRKSDKRFFVNKVVQTRLETKKKIIIKAKGDSERIYFYIVGVIVHEFCGYPLGTLRVSMRFQGLKAEERGSSEAS